LEGKKNNAIYKTKALVEYIGYQFNLYNIFDHLYSHAIYELGYFCVMDLLFYQFPSNFLWIGAACSYIVLTKNKLPIHKVSTSEIIMNKSSIKMQ